MSTTCARPPTSVLGNGRRLFTRTTTAGLASVVALEARRSS
jgi:hypothetical protein